jgi:sugar-specific transcriptional regulator TrmB
MEREIATRVHALPDKKVMEKNAEQAKERVRELMNLFEEARRAAATASSELVDTIIEIYQIKTTEQELVQVVRSHTTLRLQLSELTD